MKTLHILTDKKLYALNDDDRGIIEKFKALGIEAIAQVWDEFEVKESMNILIRTPWDYSLRPDKFQNLLDEFDKKNCLCVNNVETLKWNLDKRYMKELESLGVPVVKTSYKDSFHITDLDSLTFPVVVKPLIGAGGVDTFLIVHKGEAEKAKVLEGRAVMIQPFMSSIKSLGEFSFIFFNNTYSHAVVKNASSGEFRVQDDYGGLVNAYDASAEEIAEVADIIFKTKRKFPYVRVDVVKEKNQFILMELEAFEPELFFRFDKDAQDIFCREIAKHFL